VGHCLTALLSQPLAAAVSRGDPRRLTRRAQQQDALASCCQVSCQRGRAAHGPPHAAGQAHHAAGAAAQGADAVQRGVDAGAVVGVKGRPQLR
jgi:hypothetical protein